MFGVFRCGWPARPRQSQRWSSVRMNRTLGFLGSAAPAGRAAARPRRRGRRLRTVKPRGGGWREVSPLLYSPGCRFALPGPSPEDAPPMTPPPEPRRRFLFALLALGLAVAPAAADTAP